MIKFIETIGDIALMLCVLLLIMRMFETNRNIKNLANKVNELSLQVMEKPIVEYSAEDYWPEPFTNVVTGIEIKP